MSKRRRDRQPNLPPDAFSAPAALPPEANGATPAATPAAKRTATATTAAPAVIDWESEYGEVLGDLRRTFFIFTALVLAMVVLSFVIR
jgi:hypothetical protein